MPRISVTFSLEEVEEIERDCAVYRGRLERIAKHSAMSREEQVLRHIHCFFASYLRCIFSYFLLMYDFLKGNRLHPASSGSTKGCRHVNTL